DGWAETVADRPDAGGHYGYEKMVGGLLDMHRYAGHPDALDLVARITGYAAEHLGRERIPGRNLHDRWTDGFPLEWYTAAETLYRAYLATGDVAYRDFAEVWLYPDYWDRFIDTSRPAETYGIHAYSHCNTFSSAAMAHAATGEARYLDILRNAY